MKTAVMLLKNWIITGIAVAAILAYIVGIPPSFSAEYSRTTQSTRSENSCGNTDANAVDSRQPPSGQPPSDYESLVDNTDNSQNADNTDDSTENTPTYCSNSNSQVQGDDNTELLSTVRP
ncbi:MAG: hypothetical protein ACM3X1_07390 [Ignavibacteriales bacterium]